MEVLLASESGGHGSYVKKERNRRGSIEWKISEASRGQFRGLLHKEASKQGRKEERSSSNASSKAKIRKNQQSSENRDRRQKQN